MDRNLVDSKSLRIVIDDILIPDYLARNTLMIFTDANTSSVLDNQQWAANLNDNVDRVIQENILYYVPKSIVQFSPYDIQFKPQCKLHVNITQFKTDIYGNSILNAIYQIKNNDIIYQYQVNFYKKLLTITPVTMVNSMNANINSLSKHISNNLLRKCR